MIVLGSVEIRKIDLYDNNSAIQGMGGRVNEILRYEKVSSMLFWDRCRACGVESNDAMRVDKEKLCDAR